MTTDVGASTCSARQSLERWLPLLRCSECGGALHQPAGSDALVCAACGRKFSIVAGVPRFVERLRDDLARRTQASFGYEWTYFDDWQASGETNFQDYFTGLDLDSLRHASVLDAGCGMGRHARQLARFVGRLIAADFSTAIDVAAKHTAQLPNVLCIQADLAHLPIADGSLDFVYSFGVVHHLADTEGAVRALAAKLRSGGRLRLYLYWSRSGWVGRVLNIVDVARRVTTRLPFPALRIACRLVSVLLFVFVVAPYKVLVRLGLRIPEGWPLAVYAKYPFRILYNDQFDRFSAPLEKRYTAQQARAVAESAGLRDVQVQARFGWLVDGVR